MRYDILTAMIKTLANDMLRPTAPTLDISITRG